MTRRLADQLGLRSTGDPRRVADIAAGPGASARLLASDYGVAVDGVDISEINVKRAQAAVAQTGLTERVRFHLGDAESVPLPDDTFDALVCECAFCTFPDKTPPPSSSLGFCVLVAWPASPMSLSGTAACRRS